MSALDNGGDTDSVDGDAGLDPECADGKGHVQDPNGHGSILVAGLNQGARYTRPTSSLPLPPHELHSAWFSRFSGHLTALFVGNDGDDKADRDGEEDEKEEGEEEEGEEEEGDEDDGEAGVRNRTSGRDVNMGPPGPPTSVGRGGSLMMVTLSQAYMSLEQADRQQKWTQG